MSLRGMEEGFLGVFLSWLWISDPPSKYIAQWNCSFIPILQVKTQLQGRNWFIFTLLLHWCDIGPSCMEFQFCAALTVEGRGIIRINGFSIILRNGKTSMLNIFWNIAEIFRQTHEKSNNESIISIKTGGKNSHRSLCEISFYFVC